MAEPGEERDKAFLEEEEEEAALEAARIGGEAPRDAEDPAEQPLAEAGEGEAEGFELAEKDLEDIASHGDQHRFPDTAAGEPEEPQRAEYGEPDEEIPADG
ncbi:MAG TPA: hypothetical protein VGI73_17285 [Solirubrobacterales bacterium]|jgi:hypothetical protein